MAFTKFTFFPCLSPQLNRPIGIGDQCGVFSCLTSIPPGALYLVGDIPRGRYTTVPSAIRLQPWGVQGVDCLGSSEGTEHSDRLQHHETNPDLRQCLYQNVQGAAPEQRLMSIFQDEMFPLARSKICFVTTSRVLFSHLLLPKLPQNVSPLIPHWGQFIVSPSTIFTTLAEYFLSLLVPVSLFFLFHHHLP